MTGESAQVLVVEDEPDLADLYGTWLNERYETDVVYDASEARDRLQQGSYEVVLLDRRMPGVSGDELLDTIRAHNFDCSVAMVTAVSPDFDIIEMGFDSYVIKPVTADDLFDLVERLRDISEYERQVQQLYALVDKRAILEAEKTADQLAASDEYEALGEEIDRLQAESRSTLGAIDDSDFRSLMQGLSKNNDERTPQ